MENIKEIGTIFLEKEFWMYTSPYWIISITAIIISKMMEA
jgi:hypothetical protein